ncbi:MAG: hypothetical protein U0610_17950 [bacterium]
MPTNKLSTLLFAGWLLAWLATVVLVCVVCVWGQVRVSTFRAQQAFSRRGAFASWAVPFVFLLLITPLALAPGTSHDGFIASLQEYFARIAAGDQGTWFATAVIAFIPPLFNALSAYRDSD